MTIICSFKLFLVSTTSQSPLHFGTGIHWSLPWRLRFYFLRVFLPSTSHVSQISHWLTPSVDLLQLVILCLTRFEYFDLHGEDGFFQTLQCGHMSREGVVDLIWFGCTPSEGMRVFKWRAGYGCVLDSFFTFFFQFTFVTTDKTRWTSEILIMSSSFFPREIGAYIRNLCRMDWV